MKNNLFYTDGYKQVERKIKDFLNSQSDFLSPRTSSSIRATGDAIQELLAENFESILGDRIKEYSSEFARRAMADLAFSDKDGFYHVVDVKTHRLDTHFNMPNLTSVERLARFYEDDRNYFVVLFIAYNVLGTHVEVDKVHFVPIEFLSWNCLTIGALGWGQIQIANSNRINIAEQTRKKWMIELCDTLFEFYPAEISKIGDRIDYFKKVKERWLSKED
jgi:hypothetical protein